MEKFNQQSEPEDCPARGDSVDLLFYGVKRPTGSVSREKHEPQAGPASCLSDSASKEREASGEDVSLAEPRTKATVKGEVAEGLPGSKSVARAEGNTSNEGGPEGSCRTNCEGQAGREAQRQGAPPDFSGVGLVNSIQGHPRAVGADSGEGANRATQPAQETRPIRKMEQDWP